MGEVVRLPVRAQAPQAEPRHQDVFERFRKAWDEAERRPCIHTYREAVEAYDDYFAEVQKEGN